MRRGTRRVWPILAGFFVLATGFPLGSPPAALAVSPNVVISQVYGGGGNSGATHTHDFIELFNRGTSSASIAGWSVQYASATGAGNFGANAAQQTDLPAVSIAPGQYLLIQEASTAAVGTPLPTPDVTDATPIAMAAGAGKVALVSSTASLGCNGGSTPCSPGALAQIVDLVGYGNANFFEGAAAAPTLSASLSASREARGCMDTDDNQDDFAAGGPAPRNSSSASNPCGGLSLTINDVSAGEGNSGTTSFDFTVSLSAEAGAGGVTFDIATADDTATIADNDYVARSLTGQTIAAGNSTYGFSVLVNGDTAEEVNETFFVSVTNVTGATVSDGQGQGTIQNDDTDFCAQPYTHTYQIQGSGNSTGMNNAAVTTQGIVVGDYETSASLQGFYLQDEAGDDAAATSDGIFVFTGSGNLVSAGDRVRVSGFAGERFGETAIDGSATGTTPVSAANIIDCGTGSVGTTDVEMPFANNTFPERFEGMLVRLPQDLVIAEYFNYERFGEIVLAEPLAGETRPFTPTAVVEPGAPAQARLLANQLSRITLDDAVAAQNPEVLRHPNGDPFSLSNRFRGGDRVTNTVGVLGFGFSLYRIFPTAPAQYDATNPRPAAPEDVGGRLKVAAMNTLNFFLTLDTTASDTGPGPCGGNQNLDCRGADADQPMEFSRQRDKLIAALAGLDADVIGLNELENTPDVDPLGDPTRGVVAGLNATPGAGTYARIDTGAIGTDAIRVGLIYRPAVVQPVGDFELLTSADDPRFIDTLSRPALAQTFVELATGARFTVVVNHLKSKNSSPACDADNGDGQGNCNLVRKAAAEALVDWLATDPTGSDDPDFVIVGDLNSYAMEDPIDAVRAGADDTHGTGDDFTNLIARYQGTHAYSFVFDGMSGYLDHALSSRSLTLQVTGATEWHINSDEPDLLDYDTSFKPPAQEAIYEPNAYRSSDHDPVIIGLDLVPTQGKLTGDGTFADGSFALSAQYENGTTAATGSTSLSLTAVGSFTSTAYDWLVLSGNRATYQGVGTLDGDAGYGFLVSVLDGGAPGAGNDKIRIRIWESDGDVVYDSQPADDFTAAPTSLLTSGNLTVHKPK